MSLLNMGDQLRSVEIGRWPVSVLTPKGDGVEEGIIKEVKGHLFGEIDRNVIIVSGLHVSVVRKGRNCTAFLNVIRVTLALTAV